MPTTTSMPKKTKLLVQTRLVPQSGMRFDIERCEHDVYYGVIRTIRDLGAEVTQHCIAGHIKIKTAHNNEPLEGAIEVLVVREDAPTLVKLLREIHSCITTIKYI